jgi:hypothetical protein
VVEFLGRGVPQRLADVGVFVRNSGRLEEVLHGDPHLPLEAADGLLEHLRERRVRFLDLDFVLESVFVVEHCGTLTSEFDDHVK